MKDFLHGLILEAGAIAREYRSHLATLVVDRKSPRDLVSEADTEIESFLKREILKKFPGHGFLGEESGEHKGSEFRWVIDPIDGTVSFLHDQHFFSISIGVEKQGETVLGAVYGPALDELFEATLGGGATLNGRSIRVSSRENLQDCIVGTGFACLRAGLKHNNLSYLNRVLPRARDMRRSGSAALDMCQVACGRYDAFWELELNLYDLSAGILIVREAGGRVTDFWGGQDRVIQRVVATNGRVHGALLPLLAAVHAENEAADKK